MPLPPCCSFCREFGSLVGERNRPARTSVHVRAHARNIYSVFYGRLFCVVAEHEQSAIQLGFSCERAQGHLDPVVFATLKSKADPDSIIRHKWRAAQVAPAHLYFDIGVLYAFYQPNLAVNAELSNLINNEGSTINHTFLEFPGGHMMTLQKIDSSLM